MKYLHVIIVLLILSSCSKVKEDKEALKHHPEIYQYFKEGDYITKAKRNTTDSNRLIIFNYIQKKQLVQKGPQFIYDVQDKLLGISWANDNSKYIVHYVYPAQKFGGYFIEEKGGFVPVLYQRHYYNEDSIADMEKGKFDRFYIWERPFAFQIGSNLDLDYYIPTAPDVETSVSGVILETNDKVEFRYTELKCYRPVFQSSQLMGPYKLAIHGIANDKAFKRQYSFHDTVQIFFY